MSLSVKPTGTRKYSYFRIVCLKLVVTLIVHSTWRARARARAHTQTHTHTHTAYTHV